MVNPDLKKYVDQLRALNILDNDIKQQLIKAGWAEHDIDESMVHVSQTQAVNIPTPPVPRFGMWISFQYILLFFTMWVWTTALGGTWHYYINKHIPDELATSPSLYGIIGSEVLQGYLAAIIVSFPFFVLFFILLKRETGKNPGVKNVEARKKLIYITMIMYFVYMLLKLVSTVYGFLAATTSTRTMPHLLVDLFIPGAVCLYLLREVREDRTSRV